MIPALLFGITATLQVMLPTYLTGKLFCGHCQSPMVGVSGRSKKGPLYFYYSCKGKRTEHSCQKKNVNRDYIEKFIACSLKETMLTDKAIRALANAAVEYQEKKAPSGELEAVKARLSEVRKSVKNIVSAIEAGIFSAATQARLAELEAEERLLSGQLACLMEEMEGKLTREEIVATLELFRDGDLCDQAFREALIDTFLVAAYVYDDRVKIVFNLGGEKDSALIPFDIEDASLSDTCITDLQLHQTLLYEHFGTFVVMIDGLFVFEKKFKDIR